MLGAQTGGLAVVRAPLNAIVAMKEVLGIHKFYAIGRCLLVLALWRLACGNTGAAGGQRPAEASVIS